MSLKTRFPAEIPEATRVLVEPLLAEDSVYRLIGQEVEQMVGDAEEKGQREIFPPGPLAELKVVPAHVVLAFGGEHTLQARAFDAQNRRIRESIGYEWSVDGPVALISADEARAVVRAGDSPGSAKVQVVAVEGETRVTGTSIVDVVAEAPPKRPEGGIPRPEEVNEPLQTWRSRSVEQVWQVNVGHPDYRALADESRRKLRYLAHLLAKEIIARNFPRPEVGQVLEEMVGLLAAIDRAGAWPAGS